MRSCPTLEGSAVPLITHRVTASDCLARQGCNYHKCHRCIYRGKAASWHPGDDARPAAPSRNGVSQTPEPTRLVELPRPEAQPVRRAAGQPSPV